MAAKASTRPMRAPDFMEAEAQGLKPLGTLKTRFIVEEEIPLMPAAAGITIGEMVDERLEELKKASEVKRVHSITIELPEED